MPMPRLPQLLTSLDGETHAARCRRIVDLARVGRGTPELGQLIDELAAQSDYHAVLAVVAAAVAGDEPRLDRLAHHPSGRVARAAQAGLPLTGAAEVIAGRYREASPNDRRLLRRRLGREGRTDVVDQLIRSDIDDTERAGLLAAATAQVAAEYLPDLADLVPNLASVTHRHLGLVLAHLRERTLGAPPPQRDHWWAWAGPAIGQLIAEHPAAVLELLETAGPSTVLTTDVTRHLGALIRHDPHRAATLFAHPRHPIGYRVPAGLLTYAGLLAPGDRVAIARRLLDRDDLLATFLDALPPSERAATFDAAIVDIGVDQRIWSDALLEVLPHQVRHREARRILTLPSVRANTLATISFQGFLPAAEAGEQLAGSRRAADAEERAAASASFLLASARERRPAALTTALATLDGLRDERDPVRLAAANALARIPGWLLAETGIDRIEAFAHSAAEARDTSPATIHSLLGAAWVVIREAIGSGDIALARQGLEMVDTLAGPTGRLWFPSFEGMPRGGEALVIEALLPRLRTAAARDNYGLLFTLCAALGKRAWGATQLDSLMHKALRAPQDANVRAAAEHWLADPATRATRVGEALRIDESLAVLPIVSNTLSASRQDLLDILWKRTSLTGRLWGRKPAFVPILPGPFTRWLPRQVQGYAAALDALLATEGTATWTASRAIRTLGRLPQIGTVALEPYLASPDTARREAALGALAWTGRPRDALPRLLAVRSGDDVRVAMYAAGRCLRDTPGRVALPLVLDVLRDPATKVTARKEAVRLLGRIREPEALVELLAIGLDDSTHRDVRFAVTRTLRAWLDDERSWQVLGRVAQSGREGALSIAETFPQLLAERHRAAYARLLVPGAASGEPALVSSLGGWAPWLPDAIALLGKLVSDTHAAEPATAAQAIRQGLRAGAPADAILQTVRELSARAVDPEEPSAEAEMDLPARQRLSILVRAVTDLPTIEIGAHRGLFADIVAQLTAYPDLRVLALTVAARAIDWEAPLPGLEAVIGLVDEPLRCADLRSAVAEAVARHSDPPTPALSEAVDEILMRDTLAAGTAALTIVAWAGPQAGWNALWRNKLRVLRTNPSLTLAGWARDIVTGPPTEPR